MATDVKRLLEGQGQHVSLNGRWEVRERYRVIGPSDKFDVPGAIDDVTLLTAPTRGSVHPESATLICDDFTVDWEDRAVTGDSWILEALFVSPQFETTSVPDEYLWGEERRPVDIFADAAGNAFLNSAGDPLVGSFQDDDYDTVLEVWRTQPTFDPALAALVRGRVNSAAMTVLGLGIDAQQMRLTSYRPLEAQKVGINYPNKRLYLRFEFRPGYRPWQPRAEDQSFNAWSSGQKGAIYPTGAKEATQVPVLLNGAGVPLNGAAYKIRKSPGDTEQTITGPPVAVTNFTINPSSGLQGKELVWARKLTANFTGFIPGIM